MHRLYIVLFTVAVVVLSREEQHQPFAGLAPAHPFAATALALGVALVAYVLNLAIYTRRLKWLVNRPRIARVIRMGCLGVGAACMIDLFADAIDQGTNVLMNLVLLPIGYMAIEGTRAAIRWRWHE